MSGCGKKIEDSKEASPASPTTESEVADYNIAEDLKEELYRAIISNDTLLTEHAYDRNKTVDFVFENGETPLTLAIKYSKTEIISFIMEKTLDINFKNYSGQTPLIISLKMKKIHALNKLIKAKADLNCTDGNGIAPLMYAYEYTNERTIIKLLKYGARGNIKDISDNSFKSLLKEKNYKTALKLLSNINSVDTLSNLELVQAIDSKSTHFIEYVLFNHDDYNELIKNENFLFNAMTIEDKSKRKSVLRLLLNYGSSPNSNDKLLPLVQSIIFEQPETTSLLISYNADPLIADNNDRTPLSYTVELGNFNIMKMIFLEIVRKRQFSSRINLYKIKRDACLYLPSRSTIRNNTSITKRNVKKIKTFLNCND
jgi:ankyrin repeat protein